MQRPPCLEIKPPLDKLEALIKPRNFHGNNCASTMNGINAIISVPPVEMPPLKGVGTTLFDLMTRNKDKTAQICGLTGRTETFGDLLRKSIRAAIKMRSLGLVEGDIITTCSFNSLNSCVPFLAGLFLGVVSASTDPTISLPITAHLVQQVRPKVFFVGEEAVGLIEKAAEEVGLDAKIVVFGKSEQHMEFGEFLQPSSEEDGFTPVEVEDVDETAAILFSSGTSGLPKGICLSHRALLTSHLQSDFLLRDEEVTLSFASMYWISSVMFQIRTTFRAAARLIYPKFDVEAAWKLIEKAKVNILFASSYQLMLLSKSKPPKVDTSSLRLILTGGSPVPAEKVLEARKSFPGTIISKGYGQTETCGSGLLFNTNHAGDVELLTAKLEASGRPLPGHDYKVVDPETEQPLGPRQEGELRVKSAVLMNGYFGVDSSGCWDADGFLKTGDVAYYDDDLCFYVVDRLKEMLKFQGWHVVPAKIEGALLVHPGVEDAVVVGLPHAEDGDHPAAAVVLKKSAEVTPQELEEYVVEKVDDRHRLRGGIRFVQTIPVTPTGKINRKVVKELMKAGAI